ncbi:MAG: DUF502 domain-containing protein [Dehalococcoidia bacterium]|nr:DUF502 domain-containing protein [Dehalococcoidia bacterium]
MAEQVSEIKSGVVGKSKEHFKQRFIVGLFLLIPIGITYVILRFVFDGVDGIMQPLMQRLIGKEIPGVGIIMLLILTYLIGLLVTTVFGERAVRATQNVLLRLPLISSVYNPSKQIIDAFSGSGRNAFKRVVAIEYPRNGMWTIAFLMSIIKDADEGDMAVVYIPTSPTPQSGWLGLISMNQVRETDISVDIAFRMVLSGGILSPGTMKKAIPGIQNLEALKKELQPEAERAKKSLR